MKLKPYINCEDAEFEGLPESFCFEQMSRGVREKRIIDDAEE